MKKILIFLISAFLIININTVKAEDVIRYSEKYQIPLGSITKIPDTEELKHWFSIDLPKNENNEDLYTVEFDTSKIDLTKKGTYEVSMIFYQTTDKKYEKKFTVEVINPLANTDIKKIKEKYLEKLITIIITICLLGVLINIIFDNSKSIKISIIKNNKYIKTIKVKNTDNYELIIKKVICKLKLDSIENIILINKNDLTDNLKKQIKTDKFDYAIFIK